KVNDIEIECGNSLYQDVLDRYTVGATWDSGRSRRCGGTLPNHPVSGFFERLVPLVRAINRKLPRGKGLRIPAEILQQTGPDQKAPRICRKLCFLFIATRASPR